jgi:hypothetical protein
MSIDFIRGESYKSLYRARDLCSERTLNKDDVTLIEKILAPWGALVSVFVGIVYHDFRARILGGLSVFDIAIFVAYLHVRHAGNKNANRVSCLFVVLFILCYLYLSIGSACVEFLPQFALKHFQMKIGPNIFFMNDIRADNRTTMVAAHSSSSGIILEPVQINQAVILTNISDKNISITNYTVEVGPSIRGPWSIMCVYDTSYNTIWMGPEPSIQIITDNWLHAEFEGKSIGPGAAIVGWVAGYCPKSRRGSCYGPFYRYKITENDNKSSYYVLESPMGGKVNTGESMIEAAWHIAGPATDLSRYTWNPDASCD